MKQQHFIIQVLLVILSGGFVSCSESDPYVDSLERKYFNVSSSNITLNSGEESASLYVGTNTNCDWYVSSTDSWIHIKNMYYSGWEDVSFTVDYNYETYTRYGRIEVYIDKPIDYKYSIPITQEPTPLAEMETTYYTSSGDSHPLTVTASSSQSWTIKRKDSDSWVHLGSRNDTSPIYSGSGTESVWIYVDENTGDDRRAELTVTCGSTTKTITITQEKNPFDASMTTTNYKADGDYWPLYVTATTSQNWTIKRNYSDSWVHLGYRYDTSSTYSGSGTKSVSIYVDKNTGDSRSATLTVTCGSMTKTITITQDTPFDASMPRTSYKAEGDYWYLYVTAATSQNWTIRRNYSWVHLSYSSNTSSTYSGSGTKTVAIHVDKNRGSSRSATLTVTCGSMTKTITITQDGAF